MLIDSARPDRNRNGIYGFVDLNGNGIWDPEDETLLDFDSNSGTFPDQELGYRDGFIDRMDRYAKVRGSLSFAVSAATWAAGQPDFLDRLRGPIRPSGTNPPMRFEVDGTKIPGFTNESFAATTTAARGESRAEFLQQVTRTTSASRSPRSRPTSRHSRASSESPRYIRLDPDGNLDGMPDNWAGAYFERMPFQLPNFNDWYYRPVYEHMPFRDVRIPPGNNGLFVNCTFIGVTWVRAEANNQSPMWSVWGRMRFDSGAGRPVLENPRYAYGDDPGETTADLYPALATQLDPPNQIISMAVDPVDRGDILQSQLGMYNAATLSALPAPGDQQGAVYDTRHYSNNLRFHDCLFVETRS